MADTEIPEWAAAHLAALIHDKLVARPDIAHGYNAVFMGDDVGVQWLGSVASAMPDAETPHSGTPAPGMDATSAADDPRSLDWVPADRVAVLADGLGPSWAGTVLGKLDEVWPDWTTADTATRTTFLADWTDTILAENARDAADVPASTSPASTSTGQVPTGAAAPSGDGAPGVSLTREEFPLLFALDDIKGDEQAAFALAEKLLGIDVRAVIADIDSILST